MHALATGLEWLTLQLIPSPIDVVTVSFVCNTERPLEQAATGGG
jgi:hypothetical protein